MTLPSPRTTDGATMAVGWIVFGMAAVLVLRRKGVRPRAPEWSADDLFGGRKRALVARIAMFGLGYVGLVTGTCFAELGNDVIGYDVDRGKIAPLELGRVPIYEPGLAEMSERNVREAAAFHAGRRRSGPL